MTQQHETAPLFSVVAPVYGVEQYLDTCVASILGQSFDDFELILVDDGSPDDCPAKCDRWAAKDTRVRVIHQTNKGLSGARNTGLDAARGEFVLFVDSDDAIENDLLELCAHAIHMDSTVDVVYFGYTVPGRARKYALPANLTDHANHRRDVLWNIVRGVIPSHAWQFVAQRSLYQGITFPVGRVAEDVAVTYRVISRANKVYALPDCLYRYQVRSDSIIGRSQEKQLSYYKDEVTSFREMRAAFHDDRELLIAADINMLDHLFAHYIYANDRAVARSVAALISDESKSLRNDGVPLTYRCKMVLLDAGVLGAYSAIRNIVKSIIKGK
ncbi:glycosyltransferase family 2 protein [Bifidobacterium biavatii]|nr:glycosyltransferase family 2 protein [Bifidobacterium biavatii]